MTLTAATALYRQFVGRPMIGRPVREAFPEVIGQQVFQMFDRVYETRAAGVGAGVPVADGRAGHRAMSPMPSTGCDRSS